MKLFFSPISFQRECRESPLRGACHSLELNWFALQPQLSYDFKKIYDFVD